MTQIEALLIGDNGIHDFDGKAPLIGSALGDDTDVQRTTDRAMLVDCSNYDVVVDYLTDSSLTTAQVEGLRSFVRDGGGYLPIHCAADLTSYVDDSGDLVGREEPVAELRELIGGHFIGHPEQSPFEVTVVDSEHPVTDSVADFQVMDEPYQVAVDEDRLHVLARMDHPDLEADYPVVWVRESGAGRICYSSLGHTDEALEHETHRRILQNAIQWVART